MKRHFLALSVAGMLSLAACNNAPEEPTLAQPTLSEKQQVEMIARVMRASEHEMAIHPALELMGDAKTTSLTSDQFRIAKALTSFRMYATQPKASWKDAEQKLAQLTEDAKVLKEQAYIVQVATACYLNVLINAPSAPTEKIQATLVTLRQGNYRDVHLFARGLQKVWTLEKNRPAQLDDIRSYAMRVAEQPAPKFASTAPVVARENLTSLQRSLQEISAEVENRKAEKDRQNQADGLRILQAL